LEIITIVFLKLSAKIIFSKMSKTSTAVLIILLLAGNVFFYVKYKKMIDLKKPVAMGNSNTSKASPTYAVPSFEINTEMRRVRNTQLQLKKFAANNKCNQDYAFVIDLRIPSYKKRFFVYNLKRDSLVASSFVAHGTGSETFRGELVFSNVPDSRCSSLGKYKIGYSYKGMYGFSYKLQGLDSTNNKAFERAIVLHGHACVPDEQQSEWPICFSYGCPMVSPTFLQKLKGYISKQGKNPILLEIIY
jgi:L,D-transpeptidase catalytic domain